MPATLRTKYFKNVHALLLTVIILISVGIRRTSAFHLRPHLGPSLRRRALRPRALRSPLVLRMSSSTSSSHVVTDQFAFRQFPESHADTSSSYGGSKMTTTCSAFEEVCNSYIDANGGLDCLKEVRAEIDTTRFTIREILEADDVEACCLDEDAGTKLLVDHGWCSGSALFIAGIYT